MVHCASENCRHEIDETWCFCPNCGADNRPPEARPKVRHCTHKYIQGGSYCVNCGGKFGDRYFEVPKLQRTFGIVLIIGSGITLFAMALLIVVHNQGHGPGFDWISSWYDQPVTHVSRHGSMTTTTAGFDTVSYMFFGGVVMLIAGISALATPRSRFYTNDHF